MDVSLALRLTALFLTGTVLGSMVNWAIYSWAWNPRPISPWSPSELRRTWFDRLPILGWFALRREAAIHGKLFWLRPLLIEFGTGIAVAAMYWWEIDQLGLVSGQSHVPFAPPPGVLYCQLASHVLLLCLMLAASFIDIDEKIIPDEITIPGTLLGLTFATLMPLSLLPHVAKRANEALLSIPLAILPNGERLWLEPVTAVSPRSWPPAWGVAGTLPAIAIALGCWWLWCFALAPRIWRGRHGAGLALRLIVARVRREFARPPLSRFLVLGSVAILIVWTLAGMRMNFATAMWEGLLTALIGLAASGGIVWAVRLIGTAALKREAMGFGDVTLMMMIGTFLGWQACLVLFFLAPFAGLLIGVLQFVSRRDDEIPYGPFLCLAAAVTVVYWAPIWNWAQPLFGLGWLVPAVLIVCLAMLGLILAIWQLIKTAVFGRCGA